MKEQRACVRVGDYEYSLSEAEIRGLIDRLNEALTALLLDTGPCSACGGRENARCEICDAKE